MNTRLQQFLAAENISQGQFAESIDVAKASVSHILAGRNKPGYDFISSLIVHYPNLNIEWLLTGKGKMYRKQSMDLFGVPEDGYDSFPEEIAVQPQALASKTQTSTSIDTKDKIYEMPANQRKATKVVIFFDDGTFQEFVQ